MAELYNWYVTHSTATFQYDLCTEEFQRENIAYVQQRAPFLVAVNAAGKLCGFACAHPWHSRTAYAWDVELTVYCAHDCGARGWRAAVQSPCWTACASAATATPLPL